MFGEIVVPMQWFFLPLRQSPRLAAGGFRPLTIEGNLLFRGDSLGTEMFA
jgi:hypothetical protein